MCIYVTLFLFKIFKKVIFLSFKLKYIIPLRKFNKKFNHKNKVEKLILNEIDHTIYETILVVH